MGENKTIAEEIEESLRICEELFQETPPGIPKKPEIDLDALLNEPVVSEEPEKAEIKKLSADPAAHEAENIGETKIWKPEQVNRHLEKPEASAESFMKQETAQVQEEDEKEVSDKEKEKGSGIRSVLISLLVCVAVAVAAAVLITKFVANHTTVEGSSMEPCLENGDDLIVEKISYLTGEPERFDVVVFRYDQDTNYIKRIIGLPGETVRIEDGKIYINERAIFDQYGNGVMEDAGIAEHTITLGTDEYFVLGDNRNASKDSREEDVGAVKREQIEGKAWLRVLPFDSFGTIE